MNINKIKNKVALNEVCNNYGYDLNINDNSIEIKAKTEKLAYLKESNNKMVITVLGKEVTKEEAIQLLKDIDKAIDFAEYIEEVVKL